jgi:hypothetical protein
VEAFALRLHQLPLGAHLLKPERAQQPGRLALEEAPYILAADQRDVVAELLAIQIEEAMAVGVLLLGHGGEHPRR